MPECLREAVLKSSNHRRPWASAFMPVTGPDYSVIDWPLLAESGPSCRSNFGDLNDRFLEERTFANSPGILLASRLFPAI